MILLQTTKYRKIEIIDDNDEIIVRGSCENVIDSKKLSNNSIKRFRYCYQIQDIASEYYNTDIKVYTTNYLKNKFKTIMSKLSEVDDEKDFMKSYRDFETDLIKNIDIYNRLYRDEELFKNGIIKYGKKFLDMLGKEKLEFFYVDSAYEYGNSLYFDIDIHSIDMKFIKTLKKNNQISPLLNEFIFNFGFPYIINNDINNDDYDYKEISLNVFIIVCILCYIITESICAWKNKDMKKLYIVLKNIKLETVNISINCQDFNRKLNQMYLLLKNTIFKAHISVVNSYYMDRVIHLSKDTKPATFTNDLVLFAFNYLTNKIICGNTQLYETLKLKEEIEDYRESLIIKINLSSLSKEKKFKKIEKLKNMSDKAIKEKMNRDILGY